MKKAFTLVCLFAFSVMSVISVCAKEYDSNVEFSMPEEFVEINSQNVSEYEESIKAMGHTKDSFCEFLEKNNIIIFACTPSNSTQIQLAKSTSEFSSRIEDLSYLKDDQKKEVASKILGDSVGYTIIEMGDASYYELTYSTEQNAENKTGSVQFVTVRNKNIYTFTVFGSAQSADSALVREAEELLQCLNIKEKKSSATVSDADDIMQMILIFILIAVAFAFVVWTAVSIIKDIRNKDEDNEEITVIERRQKK